MGSPGADRSTSVLSGVAASALLAVELGLSVPAVSLALAAPFVLGVGAAAALGTRAPAAAVALFSASYAGQTAVTGYVDSAVVLVVWAVLLVLCGRRSTGTAGLLGALVGATPIAVFALAQDEAASVRVGPATVALWVLPLLTGRALRSRQERHDVDVALVRKEAERAAAAERAQRAEERAALARDVHDLLGHALTTVVVQARAAGVALPREPSAARSAVEAVEEVGREALAELRSVVVALHEGGAAAPPRDPGLGELPDLLRRMPVRVDLHVEGDVAAADDAVQGCVYRVVQECLTNTVRHSGAEAVEVVVGREGPELVIGVLDPGPVLAEPLPGSGRGLDGVRARVRALGGEVVAGPREAGFAVQVRLPAGAVR